MVKKRISFILAFLLTLFLIIVPSFTVVKADSSTSNITISFELRINDKNVVLANQNDIVDVDFYIKRTDSDQSYTTNGFQNEIYFDMEAFEFVENSIVCYDTGLPTAKYQDNIEHGKIIQCANMGNTYPAEFKFCSFQLKAIKDNVNGMVYNNNQQIYDLEHDPIPFAEKNLKVMVGIDCDHTTKTTFNQTASTCVTQGYEAYQQCTVCDALFDSSNELIAEITYFPLENHSGGTATCTQKAVCTVCSQEYGQLNQSAHTGTTIIINQKDATATEEGYTGDKICSHCNQVLEQGVATPILGTGSGAGDVNININGDYNIVGDNNNLTVNYFNNTTILTVGFLLISVLLLIIVILLIILCFKSNGPKNININLNGIKTIPTSDSPISTKNNNCEITDEIASTNNAKDSQPTTEIIKQPIEESVVEPAEEINKESYIEPIADTDGDSATAIAEDSNEDSIEEIDNTQSNFVGINKKPFETKLAEASDIVKRYYSELKDALLSYKKVKSRVSIKYDNVYAGRQQLAKFVVRGKSLYVYLALDPKTFINTKYNVSETTQKTYIATPCKYKVNGERKLVWAKELITELAKVHALQSK